MSESLLAPRNTSTTKAVTGGPAPYGVWALFPALIGGFIAGVALELQLADLDVPGPLTPVAFYGALSFGSAAGLAGLAGLAFWRPRPPGREWQLALLCALLGAGLAFGSTSLRALNFQQTALSAELEGKDIRVTGTVQAMPQLGEDGTRFRFKVASAQLGTPEAGANAGRSVELPPLIDLGWYAGFGARSALPAAGLADTAAELPDFLPELQRQPQPIAAGERWQLTVRLRAPHGSSNPHGFDYELWLWEQGVQATGYVRAGPRDVAPLKLGSSWAHPVERARQHVRSAIFERVDDRALAGVLAALVTGDQSAIDRAGWDVFRATGVAHLMSISGLHITML